MIETTIDTILNDMISIIQPKEGYRFAIDPIILSSVIKINNNDKILDIGSGVGTISLILSKNNNKDIEIDGVEIQKELYDLSLKNITLNKLDNVKFYNNNIKEYSDSYKEKYDIIVTNPPYNKKDANTNSLSDIKNIANSEQSLNLKEWINDAYKLLKNSGEFYMIHRADRLDDIINAMNNKFGNIKILPIYPKANQPANRVIIYSRKNKKDPLEILNGLILHEKNGEYTCTVKDVLYNGIKIKLE